MPTAQINGASAKPAPRKVSLLLALGIAAFPGIFIWFLLRKGHSPVARAIGFGWAASLLLFTPIILRALSSIPQPPATDTEIASQPEGSRTNGTTTEKVAENAPALPAPKATIAATPAPPPVPTMDPERRRGMHCLNNWDGSHWGMQNEIKRRLRDPDSFEHIETRIAPIDEVGNHAIFMSFRARNGFGGMDVQQAIGAVDHAQCKLIIMHM